MAADMDDNKMESTALFHYHPLSVWIIGKGRLGVSTGAFSCYTCQFVQHYRVEPRVTLRRRSGWAVHLSATLVISAFSPSLFLAEVQKVLKVSTYYDFP